MEESPESIVHNYFACMRSGGLGVAELFHEHAELLGLGTRVVGRDAIRSFYTNAIRDAQPNPSEPVALLTHGSRVIAEILIQLKDGSTTHAIDVFEVEAGRIRSLTYFIADYPKG